MLNIDTFSYQDKDKKESALNRLKRQLDDYISNKQSTIETGTPTIDTDIEVGVPTIEQPKYKIKESTVPQPGAGIEMGKEQIDRSPAQIRKPKVLKDYPRAYARYFLYTLLTGDVVDPEQWVKDNAKTVQEEIQNDPTKSEDEKATAIEDVQNAVQGQPLLPASPDDETQVDTDTPTLPEGDTPIGEQPVDMNAKLTDEGRRQPPGSLPPVDMNATLIDEPSPQLPPALDGLLPSSGTATNQVALPDASRNISALLADPASKLPPRPSQQQMNQRIAEANPIPQFLTASDRFKREMDAINQKLSAAAEDEKEWQNIGDKLSAAAKDEKEWQDLQSKFNNVTDIPDPWEDTPPSPSPLLSDTSTLPVTSTKALPPTSALAKRESEETPSESKSKPSTSSQLGKTPIPERIARAQEVLKRLEAEQEAAKSSEDKTEKQSLNSQRLADLLEGQPDRTALPAGVPNLADVLKPSVNLLQNTTQGQIEKALNPEARLNAILGLDPMSSINRQAVDQLVEDEVVDVDPDLIKEAVLSQKKPIETITKKGEEPVRRPVIGERPFPQALTRETAKQEQDAPDTPEQRKKVAEAEDNIPPSKAKVDEPKKGITTVEDFKKATGLPGAKAKEAAYQQIMEKITGKTADAPELNPKVDKLVEKRSNRDRKNRATQAEDFIKSLLDDPQDVADTPEQRKKIAEAEGNIPPSKAKVDDSQDVADTPEQRKKIAEAEGNIPPSKATIKPNRTVDKAPADLSGEKEVRENTSITPSNKQIGKKPVGDVSINDMQKQQGTKKKKSKNQAYLDAMKDMGIEDDLD